MRNIFLTLIFIIAEQFQISYFINSSYPWIQRACYSKFLKMLYIRRWKYYPFIINHILWFCPTNSDYLRSVNQSVSISLNVPIRHFNKFYHFFNKNHFLYFQKATAIFLWCISDRDYSCFILRIG